MARPQSSPTAIPGFGCIYQPSYRDKRTGELRKSGIWWLKYSASDGQFTYRSTKTADRDLAFAELVKVAGRRVSGDLQNATPERVKFGVLFDLLEDDYRRQNRSSLPELVLSVGKHLRPAFSEKRVIELRKRDIDRFIASKLNPGASGQKPLAPGTINRLLANMRRAMQLGAEEDPPLVNRIPPWFAGLDLDNTRTGIMSHEVYRKLCELLPPHARLVLVIGYHLGMRRGEILGLRWSQVDLARGLITLTAKQTKNKQARTAPIYGEMGAYLTMALAERDAQYPACEWVIQIDGERIHRIDTAWQRARELAGVPDQRLHDLRRTASTNMDRAGVPGIMIDRIVGWKSESMRRRYRIGEDSDAISAGQRLDAYFRESVSLAEVKSAFKQ